MSKTSGVGGPTPEFPLGPNGPVRRPDTAGHSKEKVEDVEATTGIADAQFGDGVTLSAKVATSKPAARVALGMTGALVAPVPLATAALKEVPYDPKAAPNALAQDAMQYIVSQLS